MRLIFLWPFLEQQTTFE